jgi:hypothetical protein
MADQTTMDPRPTTDPTSATDSPTPEQATGTREQPMGTRELRDAQATANQPRPSIQATGDRTATASARTATETAANAPLFDDGAGQHLRERWLGVQTAFVDEPRAAVQKADALVAEVLKQLTDSFAREREALEAGWSGGGNDDDAQTKREISTEDLRQAIQRYRSFFNRLLAL